MDKYGVVGNPIKHSLSPQIHTLFAQQTAQDIEYKALLLDKEFFEKQIQTLIEAGYQGINVTIPFKEQAWALADRLSPRARDAEAVNTLIFQADGQIAGDNTDGIGLTRDMVNNHKILLRHRRILILGAGGAARGVLGLLFAQKPDLITIVNRSQQRALDLLEQFNDPVKYDCELNTLRYDELDGQRFDLIINATAASLNDEIPPIPDSILGVNTICYDMMYNLKQPTAFVKWASERGALREFDGLGMLVEQAAEAFFIWRGVRPQTDFVIEQLRHLD